MYSNAHLQLPTLVQWDGGKDKRIPQGSLASLPSVYNCNQGTLFQIRWEMKSSASHMHMAQKHL